MFHPSANRVAAFLEISALFISLARSGGSQYKAGVLHIESSNGTSGSGFGRKSIGWRARKEPKWCALRESYLVVSEEPGEVLLQFFLLFVINMDRASQLKVWDVFLLDSDFKIERPRRYYRQGLNILNSDITTPGPPHSAKISEQPRPHPDSDCMSIISSIKSRVSRIFPVKGDQRVARDSEASGDDLSPPSSSISLSLRAQAPMLDPSINVDPIPNRPHDEAENMGQPEDEKRNDIAKDVSKHTFYVVNSQMRLKISAHNEVR